MSFPHQEPLGEGLALALLTPLMEYADTLAETPNHGAQSQLLWVLINDVQQRLEGTFAAVNATSPGIKVYVPGLQ